MALSFEVNKDKTVTIYNDDTIFSHQADDPDVEGYEVFATKARAEEWATAAIARYEAEIAAAKLASEEANAAAEAEFARSNAVFDADTAAMDAAVESDSGN